MQSIANMNVQQQQYNSAYARGGNNNNNPNASIPLSSLFHGNTPLQQQLTNFSSISSSTSSGSSSSSGNALICTCL